MHPRVADLCPPRLPRSSRTRRWRPRATTMSASRRSATPERSVAEHPRCAPPRPPSPRPAPSIPDPRVVSGFRRGGTLFPRGDPFSSSRAAFARSTRGGSRSNVPLLLTPLLLPLPSFPPLSPPPRPLSPIRLVARTRRLLASRRRRLWSRLAARRTRRRRRRAPSRGGRASPTPTAGCTRRRTG